MPDYTEWFDEDHEGERQAHEDDMKCAHFYAPVVSDTSAQIERCIYCGHLNQLR